MKSRAKSNQVLGVFNIALSACDDHYSVLGPWDKFTLNLDLGLCHHGLLWN
jgi:hypothetical protein